MMRYGAGLSDPSCPRDCAGVMRVTLVSLEGFPAQGRGLELDHL